MAERNQYYKREGSLVGGLILIGLGTYFLLREFGIVTIGLDKLWPAFMILVGVGLILGHFRGLRPSRNVKKSFPSETPPGD